MADIIFSPNYLTAASYTFKREAIDYVDGVAVIVSDYLQTYYDLDLSNTTLISNHVKTFCVEKLKKYNKNLEKIFFYTQYVSLGAINFSKKFIAGFGQLIANMAIVELSEASRISNHKALDIANLSQEARDFLEAFSEDAIICKDKYKNHKGLVFKGKKKYLGKTGKIYLGEYEGEKRYSIVDAELFDELNKHNWYLIKKLYKPRGTYKYYVKGTVNGYSYSMHTYIKGYLSGYNIDHWNGDGLDNRWANLRFSTISQNNQNRDKKADCSSEYIGVCWHVLQEKWCVMCAGKWIGCFSSEMEGAIAYDKYILLNPKFGEGSRTNILTYKDVENLSFEKEFAERTRSLPKYISKNSSGRYDVRIQSQNQLHRAYTNTIEDAIEKLNEFQLIIEENNKAEWEEYLQTPIQRNRKGFAVISTKNSDEYIVDDDEWHFLSFRNWHSNGSTSTYAHNYHLGKIHRYLKQGIIDEILSIYPEADIVIDHVNHKTNDNRKHNLRINTLSGNSHNVSNRGVSKYSNVYYRIDNNTWSAEIKKDHDRYYCGTYNTEDEAAIAVCYMDELLYKKYANKYSIPQKSIDEYYDKVIENVKFLAMKKSGLIWKGYNSTSTS